MYVNKIMETALTATRIFKVQPYINALIMVMTVVFSFIIVPNHGILGAGYLLIITGLIQLLIRVIILEILCKENLK